MELTLSALAKVIGRNRRKMSKILITGGVGFLGYFISKILSENKENQITIVDNLARGKLDSDFESLIKNDNLKFIRADLKDPKTFLQLDNDFDYIYHLAAVIGVKNVIGNPDQVLHVNAISTLNLLEFSKNIKTLKRILFSSTSEIYAGTLKNFGIEIPTNEEVKLTIEDIKSRRTTYALSKMFCESAFFSFGDKYNIPFTIVRYHNVYGPRMGFAHVIPETFLKIVKNKDISVPSPNHSRAFCYVDDAVKMTVKACTMKKTNKQILNIGNSDEELKIKDLVLKIAKVMNKEIKIDEQPETLGSPVRRCPDVSRIERLTGLKATVSLNDGIKKTYDWYKNKLDEKL